LLGTDVFSLSGLVVAVFMPAVFMMIERGRYTGCMPYKVQRWWKNPERVVLRLCGSALPKDAGNFEVCLRTMCEVVAWSRWCGAERGGRTRSPHAREELNQQR
jgi:hypothetical protein